MNGPLAILVLSALPQISLAAAPFSLSLDEARVGAVPPGWSVSKTGQGPGSQGAVVEDADNYHVARMNPFTRRTRSGATLTANSTWK